MNTKKKKIQTIVTIVAVVATLVVLVIASQQPALVGTAWALVPPVVAIVLALVTKEVYSSLFLGILVGALFYTGFGFEDTVLHIYNNGFLAQLGDGYNMGILIFLVILGAMVSLMNKAGGSAAFGRWASTKIKSRVGAQICSIALGALIFIDDYFNCLTVGSVMRPVTDKHKVSRAKLAYLIDATAAPVCIIAPISSWAAAVSSSVESDDGFKIFLQAIPYNYYALLTILMMVSMVLLKMEFGPMKKNEKNALNGDLFTVSSKNYEAIKEDEDEKKGTVLDLVIPIIALVVCCIIGMIYTGGFFSGENIIKAFSNCDASVGLALGSFFAMVITIVIFLVRRVLPFRESMSCIAEGFKAMVPAILILTFAWTLKAMTDSLGASVFVETVVKNASGNWMNFLPAIIFLIGCLMAFATGTSWGTFGILIPIVVDVFAHDPQLMIISISACMAGAVCGDHCSPISDTTIMASAGAQCDHVNHVSTQLPYAIVAAAVSFVTYIVAGFTQNVWISLLFGIALMMGTLLVIKKMNGTVEEA